MNDASSGKLPAAGVAGKTVYALQYADERSVSEVSNQQDLALKRLAEAMSAVAREEYAETRTIRIAGPDRSYLVERTVHPEDLSDDVEYTFSPGSMLSRNKESVKNELLALLPMGLVDPNTVKKYIDVGVPDLMRTDVDLQEAKIRRVLRDVVDGTTTTPQPDPWDNPAICCGVLEEFMLSAKFKLLGQPVQTTLSQLWQAYKLQLQAQMAPPPGPPGAPPAGGPPGGPPHAPPPHHAPPHQGPAGTPGPLPPPGAHPAQPMNAPPPAGPPMNLGGPERPLEAPQGARLMQLLAEAAQAPPKSFERVPHASQSA